MPPPSASGPVAEHRTVARVMSILELVLASDPEGLRLADLSTAIEAPKSTVHGLAKGLVATGYFREERGRYFVGPAISSLLAVGPLGLPSTFHHVLEELTAKWQETSTIATLVGDSIVYVDSVEPASLIRAAPQLHQRLPIWPRSSGKCLLAFMEPKRLDAYLRRNPPGPAEEVRLRAELAEIRETLVGMNAGESVAEHIGLASPILDGTSPVTMAVAIVGPKFRVQDRVDEIAEGVRAAAQSLSRGPGR